MADRSEQPVKNEGAVGRMGTTQMVLLRFTIRPAPAECGARRIVAAGHALQRLGLVIPVADTGAAGLCILALTGI